MPGRAFDTGKPSSIGISHLVSKHHHQNHNLIFKGACSCLVAITTFHRSCCLCTKRSWNLPLHGVLQCEPVRARSYQSGPFAVRKQHTENTAKKITAKMMLSADDGNYWKLDKEFFLHFPGLSKSPWFQAGPPNEVALFQQLLSAVVPDQNCSVRMRPHCGAEFEYVDFYFNRLQSPSIIFNHLQCVQSSSAQEYHRMLWDVFRLGCF
jgi:hypothetical protein